MSLMRLLSAGKTLVSGGKPSGRYRINTGYHLPKFGSTKNPFKKPVEEKPFEEKPSAQVEVQMPAPIQKEEEKVRLSSAEFSAAGLSETQRAPQEAVVATAPPLEKVHPILAMLDWMDDTAVLVKQKVVKLELSKLIPRLKPAVAVKVAAKNVAGPIQPELSLEKVRVVRNDLSDADLEILAVKPQPRVVRVEAPKEPVSRMETEPELIGAIE